MDICLKKAENDRKGSDPYGTLRKKGASANVEWLERMNRAVDYMEACLAGEFDVEEAARAACSSTFHFQRLFHVITGVTVSEYMRRRRLTLAAQELASARARVIDAALKFGYDTPESFSKAFRKMHGVSPSAVRTAGAHLKAFPRLSFQIFLKGEKDMDYRIVEKGAFKVVGKGVRVSTRNGVNFTRVPRFWEESEKDGTVERICAHTGPMGMFGICMEFDRPQEEFTYMIAVEKPNGAVPADFVEKEIPPASWAVFDSVGPMPGAVQDVWKRIFSEWFPATGYEHADAPEMEVYRTENTSDAEYRCEVWVPIIKK